MEADMLGCRIREFILVLVLYWGFANMAGNP